MKRSGVTAPSLRGAFCNISGDHALVGENAIRERFREILLHSLVRIPQPRNRLRSWWDAGQGVANGRADRSVVRIEERALRVQIIPERSGEHTSELQSRLHLVCR